MAEKETIPSGGEFVTGLDESGNVLTSPSTVTVKSNDALGAYHLADTPRYYEPQRANNFKFYCSDILDIIRKSSFTNTYDYETDEDNTLSLSVKSSSVPHFDIEKITINRGNSQMHFAGKPTFKDGQITVRDYIGAHTKEILLAWQRMAYDPTTEKIGLAKDYKKTANLVEYTPDYQIVRTWILEGCWVSSISEGNFDHDSVEAKTMDVTLVYDRAYLDETDKVSPSTQN